MEGGKKMNSQVEHLAMVWPGIKNIFSVPHSEEEYDNLVSVLDEIVEQVRENENHPLASLMESLGILVENYEKQNVPEPTGTSIEVLRFLMQEHNLKQSDLPEIGSQGVVSEILTGKRKLNIRQIKNLCSRFNISPAVFLQND